MNDLYMNDLYMRDKEDIGIDIDKDNFSIQNEIAKFADVEVPGWKVCIRLFIPPTTTKGGILLTAKTHDEHEFQNCVGLVVKKGPDCYKGPSFIDGCAHWCQVGEWRVFPRHTGLKIKYKGMPLWMIDDVAVGIGVKDPRDVER